MVETLKPQPTLHITNWSSRNLHGPGRKWSIMAKPRHWERGDGRLLDFTPDQDALTQVKQGVIDFSEYERRFRAKAERMAMFRKPGWLFAYCGNGKIVAADFRQVRDGDTLLCACSVAAANIGHCHRVWVADILRQAGWAVCLDGKEVS